MNADKCFDALFRDFHEVGPVGCGVNITRNGKTVYEFCSGYADKENKLPLQRDSIIRLYSNSKVFTNVALMTLYEQGKFLLDDPLEKYLPEFADPQVGFFTGNGVYSLRPARQSIRIRDLMSMASGLPYDAHIAGGAYTLTHAALKDMLVELEKGEGYSVRDFSRHIARIPLLFDPGTSWSYGYSHDIIGALIEVIADMDFEDYLRKAIFEPLGMKDTGFFISDEKRHRLSRMYTPKNERGEIFPVTDWDVAYDANHRYKSGGGGLLSTMEEFGRFANMLSMGGKLEGVRIIGRKTIDLMRENHLNDDQLSAFRAAHANGWEFLSGYGYGLGVRTLINKAEAGANGSIGEFGWAGAAGTYMLADPQEQFSVTYVQQVLPNPYEGYCHPRIRALAYALLDDL